MDLRRISSTFGTWDSEHENGPSYLQVRVSLFFRREVESKQDPWTQLGMERKMQCFYPSGTVLEKRHAEDRKYCSLAGAGTLASTSRD